MAPLSSVARIVPLSRRSTVRLLAGAILCALVLVGTSTLAGAASSKASGAKISAHLSKKSFTKAQVKKVKLIYKFSAPSKSFAYRLSFKKGSKWLKVKSVKRKGTFKGSHTMTVKKVFAGKPVKVGRYRLRLSADGGSKLLSFKVVKGRKPANTALPTISGTTTQGQKLTASRGSWSNSPTSRSYRWRRCNSFGVSCADISGASASSYTLAAVDVNSTIRVVVTASNSYGSASATSAQTAVVATVPAISAGYSHTCALLSDHTVECWGYNGEGELGDGTTTDSATPVQVKDVAGTGTLSNVTQISAGYSHTCALLTGGAVECWGYNYNGQLGNGTTTDSATPVQVKDVAGTGTLSNVTQISAGGSHTCALLSDNTVECWGYNGEGELGNGETADRTTPVSVIGIP